MYPVTPPGAGFSVQLPDGWTAVWEWIPESSLPGRWLRAVAPGADSTLEIIPVCTRLPWDPGDGVGPLSWENLLELGLSKRSYIARHGSWGDFSGIVQWRESEDRVRTWLLRGADTVLNVIHHCAAEAVERDGPLIEAVLSTLRLAGPDEC